MADNKGNFFKRLVKKISDVFSELKRVTWPTGEKLAKTAAVVLLVIVFFAVYLTLIGNGGRWILDKVGFYDAVETTAATTAVAETTPAAETSESVTETEASAQG
ncbi:MAG: preprotein translocase subunit SecE [Saccharofermentans sp.]|nr:preprotein translocase subunit SecE [Saccharofermentans sp.]